MPFDLDQIPRVGYLVSQSCGEPGELTPILLTHYFSRRYALRDFRFVSRDRYAAIIYLGHPPHLEQFHQAIASNKYQFFKAELDPAKVEETFNNWDAQISSYIRQTLGLTRGEVQLKLHAHLCRFTLNIIQGNVTHLRDFAEVLSWNGSLVPGELTGFINKKDLKGGQILAD